MAFYVDGFVLPLPKKNLAAYRRMSRRVGKVWREHGALDYRECAAEDLPGKSGVGFKRAVGAKRGDTVVFAWIRYRSRKHRDRVNAKVMNDPRIAVMAGKPMPFDLARMLYGGFAGIVEA
jgi:uncharacterized protein YbaA (DUF1428 family)